MPWFEIPKSVHKRLVEGSECSEIIYAQHIERNGKLLFEEVCERNLEGMVAKRRMGPYAEHGWLKIKNPKYTQAEERQDMFEVEWWEDRVRRGLVRREHVERYIQASKRIIRTKRHVLGFPEFPC